MFDGDPTGFFARPISGTLLVVFIVVALWPAVKLLRDRRKNMSNASASL
jgi:putative tricarboxylic transport membrane protein